MRFRESGVRQTGRGFRRLVAQAAITNLYFCFVVFFYLREEPKYAGILRQRVGTPGVIVVIIIIIVHGRAPFASPGTNCVFLREGIFLAASRCAFWSFDTNTSKW